MAEPLAVQRIGEVGYDDLEGLWSEIDTSELASLQDAAQRLVDALYARFGGSIVLARVFATVELAQLPADDRAFVQRFAREHDVTAELRDDTPVLSLLSSRGVDATWNDRRNSRAHLGIPLLSAGFVEEIPMISRLLGEIGFNAAWERTASSFVTKTLANVNGIFYVEEAHSAVDERGRAIIPARDFVESYGIKTVFGFGGSYLSRQTFIAAIVFCRERVMRTQAIKFVPLIGSFKAATTRLVSRGAIFAPRPDSR